MDYLSGNRDEIPSNHINLSAPPVAPIPARSIMPEEVHEPAAKRPAYDHKEKESVFLLLLFSNLYDMSSEIENSASSLSPSIFNREDIRSLRCASIDVEAPVFF